MTSILIFSLLLVTMFALAFVLGRPRGSRDHRDSGRPGSAAPLPVAAQEYLSQLDSALGLPTDVRADIRAELGDHLQDSIAAIEAEGLDHDRAAREALARLGRPTELARQLRHAHQTTRRLLAGAAGGVFQAGLGIVFGYIWSFVIFIGVALVAAILGAALHAPLGYLAERLPEWPPAFRALFTAAVPLALVSLLPAFLAGRWSVRALTRGSRRAPAQIARWWALGGTLVIAWYVVFGLTAEQSWLAVPLELLIPVAFAVGALWRPNRTLFLPRWRVPVALIAVLAVVFPVVVFAGAPVSTSGRSWSTDYAQEGVAFDRVAPAWDADLGLSRWSVSYGDWGGSPVIETGWIVDDPAALAGFRDLRSEAWRAVQLPGAPDWVDDYIPAPGYSAPYATQPVTLGDVNATSDGGRSLAARFDVGHVRTEHWAVFLTGVAPDGIRYRLELPTSVQTSFSGTVWDWLRASE